MTDFFNPYQFIGFTGLINGKPTPTVKFQDILNGRQTHVRHDLWQAKALSGRIICQLKNLSPFLVGMEHIQPEEKSRKPVEVRPYTYNGEVKVPGNSLRGMVASVAEALSQSAFRVLSNQSYSSEPLRQTYDFFDQKHVPENQATKVNYTNARPWGDPARDSLTLAESVFGVVWDDKDFPATTETDQATKKMLRSRNLASRIRFSDATCKTVEYISDIPRRLKTLGSPKPAERPKPGKSANPVPCMYFKNRSGSLGYITRENLNAQEHEPNGRKFYLPFNQYSLYESADKGRWETKEDNRHDNQRMKCRLLKKDQSFYFHIDFENLYTFELGLLLTALSPSAGFIHRLGLGKPLGLGMMKLDVLGVFLTQRAHRYSVQGLKDQRYQEVWKGVSNWPTQLSGYAEEKTAFTNCAAAQLDEKINAKYVDEDTLQALVKLSQVPQEYDKTPICYPFTTSQGPFNENEGFRWYNQNKQRKVNLLPIDLTRPVKPMQS